MRILQIVIGIWVLILPAFGQQFKGEVALPGVVTDGFYKIELSPTLSTYTNTEFSNIRIFDQQKAEVPYLYQKEAVIHYSEKFTSYEILEKRQEKNCCTILTLRNPDNRPINNISLSIKNAEVTKRATLLGSDDRENWFALKEHFVLHAINNQYGTAEIKVVDFPLSNYSFYRLQLEDSTSAPLNILNAGYYEQRSEDGKYTEVSDLHIAKSDSILQKRTYVQLLLDTSHVIDKFALSMTGQPYFLRKASLYNKQFRKNKKGETEGFYEWLYDFEISSKQASVINLDEIKTNELMLSIENEDNPSLEVSSAKVFQRNRYLIAWLKKENQYTLKIGPTDLTSPRYDLGFFKDSIPDQLPQLTLGSLTIFAVEKAAAGTTIFTNQLVIWVAIILVVALLGFMSAKLIREATAEKKES